jgi:hypothetical protein
MSQAAHFLGAQQYPLLWIIAEEGAETTLPTLLTAKEFPEYLNVPRGKGEHGIDAGVGLTGNIQHLINHLVGQLMKAFKPLR